jgi:hypothetical protein
MRLAALVFLAALLAGAATAQDTTRGPSEERVLSSTEVVAALTGAPVFCLRDTADTPTCDSVFEIISANEERISFRDHSGLNISPLAEPQGQQIISQIKTVPRHRQLLSALEAQRASQDFHILRFNETFSIEYVATTGRWCNVREPDYNLANMTVGFSRDLSVDGEVAPVAPDLMDSLRAFFRELIMDSFIVEMSNADAELAILRNSLISDTRTCATYFGVGPTDRPTITRREFSDENGARLEAFDDYITAHDSRSGIQLTP